MEEIRYVSMKQQESWGWSWKLPSMPTDLITRGLAH